MFFDVHGCLECQRPLRAEIADESHLLANKLDLVLVLTHLHAP